MNTSKESGKGAAMIVYRVNVFVKEDRIDDFIGATVENHENTRKEPGNLRFDVLRSADDPALFMLYEVYDSPEAVDAHKATAHYLKWRETVAGWMAKPREGVKYEVVRPLDETLW